MPWHIPVLLRIVMAHMVTPVMSKKLAGARSRTRSIRLMFLVCAVLAGLAVLVTGTPVVFDSGFWLVCGLGFANSFAVYALWRAQAISLSRQALFTMMDDIIPVVMGYFLLGESKLFTPMLGVGVLLCVGGVTAFSIVDSRQKAAKAEQKRREEKAAGVLEVGGATVKKPLSIFVWIGIYSVIWGIAHFAFRYYAVAGMPVSTFVLGWYGGAFIGSNVVLLLMGKKEMGEPLPRKQIGLVALLAAVIAICLALEYWASMYAPLAVTQPIFQVTEMLFPTLIGFFYFKEIKELTLHTKIIFGIAFIGSLILALSY